jgi:hypothetical protein
MHVVGVGLHKTGTTSLAHALDLLGFSHAPFHGAKVYDDIKEGRIDSYLEQYTVFSDVPWCFAYQDIYRQCPDARFILTVRDEQSWLRSVVNHFAYDSEVMTSLSESSRALVVDLHEWVYGRGKADPSKHQDVWLARYRGHNDDVRNFFAGNLNFMEMDIIGGDGWERLCSFLGLPVPPPEFPRRNPTWLRDMLIRRISDWNDRNDFGATRFQIRRLAATIQHYIELGP